MKSDRRGSWYLLTGLVLGVAVGLAYSWVISPVKYIDAPPYALREDYKEQYRLLVAYAYLYNGDLLRAQDRLAQLKDDDIVSTMTMQAQRAQAEGHPAQEVRALSMLASELGHAISSTPASLDGTPVLPATTQAAP
jgi:hypothetical protein